MTREIQQFFDSYRESFNRLDGRAVSAHYQVPSMISSNASEGLFVDDVALEANNDALCNLYRDNGFVSANYAENMCLKQGEDFYLADLQWTIQWHDKPAQQFNTTYQLVRRGDANTRAWKIEHVTA
jgi:hypothetical protein